MGQDLDHQVQIAWRGTADAFFPLPSQPNTLSRANALRNMHHVRLALAWRRAAQRDLTFTTVGCLLQSQRQVCFPVCPRHDPRRACRLPMRTASPLGRATSGSAKELFKKATESAGSRKKIFCAAVSTKVDPDIFIAWRRSPTALLRSFPGRTITVIFSAFFRVLEDFVCFTNVFEFVLGA